MLLFVGLILIQIILFNNRSNEEFEAQEIQGMWKENRAVVVDKMIERINHMNPMKQKCQKYVLFIQTVDRKVIELVVSQQVFNHVEAGDHGVVKDNGEGTYDFEKVS